MTLQKLITTSALTLAGAIACSLATAHAGTYSPVKVNVDLLEQHAEGDLYTARNTQDDQAFIGCGTRHSTLDDGTLFVHGFCQARMSDGTSWSCFSQNPDLVNQIKNVNDSSYITFRWNDDNECTYIGSSTQSFYLPKAG